MNHRSEILPTLWQSLEESNTEGDYVRSYILYASIESISGETFVSQRNELLRLLGVNGTTQREPTSVTDAAEALDHTVGPFAGSVRTLSSARPLQVLDPGFEIAPRLIPTFEVQAPTWARTPSVEVAPITLRIIDHAFGIVGNSCIRTEEGLFVDQSVVGSDQLTTQLNAHESPEQIEKTSSKKFKTALYLAPLFGTAWGHFWAEIAVRLALLNGAPSARCSPIPIILSDHHIPAARQTIVGLMPDGYEPYFLPEGTHFEAETLLIVDVPIFRPCTIPDGTRLDEKRVHSCQRLYSAIEDRLLKSLNLSSDSSVYRRIFWSRKGAKQRRSGLLEALLESLARAHDFEVIDPSELPITEQISAAQSAQVSFGAYGSWLNQISTFSAPGSQHLIITNDRPFECRYAFTNALERGLNITIGQGMRGVPIPYYVASNYHGIVNATPQLVQNVEAWLEQTS